MATYKLEKYLDLPVADGYILQSTALGVRSWGPPPAGTGNETFTSTKVGAYNIQATDQNILCDTSGGAFAVTLPGTPTTGDKYNVILVTGGNDLTIDGNGKNVAGDATAKIKDSYDAVQIIYNGSEWVVR